ncbi:ABC transporter permease [Halobacteriales archaeon SW_7_65_23]|nr:MAG: ABC transporter permease [Halobacteriales archaeon SW_7_65_23]
MKRTNRLGGLVGLAFRQLASNRARTAFAVVGVAFAVLSVTLLFSVGTGVLETGEQLLDQSEQDLWVSGGPIDIQPGTVGGFQNPLVDAHAVAAEMEAREAVRTAAPIGLQTVYVSTDGEEFDTVVGSGTRSDGPLVDLQAGGGFNGSDTHYADGAYDRPMTQEAIIDPATAEQYNLSVGDTFHVGGTITDARRNEFEVVGISGTFRQFVGTQTVTLRLSELQTLTGAAYDDRATLITVRLEDGADVEAVKADLEAAYPEFTIRTNSEQLRTVLERQAAIIAGGLSLVALSIISGMLLSLNLFLSLVYQQRDQLAVFRAIGGSRGSTVGLTLLQGTIIATAGCALGLGLTPPLASAIDWAAMTLTGFEGLVQIPTEGYLVGAGVAAAFGVLGTLAGVLRLSGDESVARLTQ